MVYSSSMADCVKHECRECGAAVPLTSMRGHTKSVHALSISDYKARHGNHRERVIARVLHRCGLCGEDVQLDSDDIAHHLKRSHDISHKDYNSRWVDVVITCTYKFKTTFPSRFMTLKRDDKTVAKQKTKKCLAKKTPKLIPEKVNSIREEVSAEERAEVEEEGCGEGPSNGVCLTIEQREANLSEVYRLQRRMLWKLSLNLSDSEDEEEGKETDEEDLESPGNSRNI